MLTRAVTEFKKLLPNHKVRSLVALSLSSGLPLGLVLFLVPGWMKKSGVDIKTIGILTLVQVPYAFKFLWSPVMDRLAPPTLRGKRGWTLTTQLLLAASVFGLAAVATDFTVAGVAALSLLVSFFSASQDISLDGYAIEVLTEEEQGIAIGSRTAMYRVGMWLSGNIALTVGPSLGWNVTIALLGVILLALMPVTFFAPDPVAVTNAPTSFRAAMWDPLVGFLSRPRALEIVAFVILYKLADNLAGALVRPFLVEQGYSDFDIGVGSGTVVVIATILGNVVGGIVTTRIGVSRALWVFGIIQGLSNAGYALIANMPPERTALYAAMAVESATSGMGSVAFTVLLVKLTEKRFSATQYALMSSLFALSRTLGGPPAGALVYALGWRDFFWLTIAMAIPGLVMLRRFAPWGSELHNVDSDAQATVAPGVPWSRQALVFWAMVSAAAATTLGILVGATLSALKALRETHVFDVRQPLLDTVVPQSWSSAIDLISALVFGLMTGVAVAAAMAARGKRP